MTQTKFSICCLLISCLQISYAQNVVCQTQISKSTTVNITSSFEEFKDLPVLLKPIKPHTKKETQAFLKPAIGSQHQTINVTSSFDPPINVDTNFFTTGMDPSIPSDNEIAVGNNDAIVITSNLGFRVYNELGANTISLPWATWADEGSLGINLGAWFDPRIVYDRESDRYLISILVRYVNASNNTVTDIILGYSQSNDPTANWNIYKITAEDLLITDTGSFDFQTMGISANNLFVRSNRGLENYILQFGLTEGYQGNPLNAQTITFGSNLFDSDTANTFVGDIIFIDDVSTSIGTKSYGLVSVEKLVSGNITNLLYVVQIDEVSSNIEVVELDIAVNLMATSSLVSQSDGLLLLSTPTRSQSGFLHNGIITFSYLFNDVSDNTNKIYVNDFEIATTFSASTLASNEAIINIAEEAIADAEIQPIQCEASDCDIIIGYQSIPANSYYSLKCVLLKQDNTLSNPITIKEGTHNIIDIDGLSTHRIGDYFDIQPKYDTDNEVWIIGQYADFRDDHPFYSMLSNDPIELASDYVAQLIFDETLSADNSISDSKGILVYPNPFSEVVNFSFKGIKGEVEIGLYDVTGKRLKVLKSTKINNDTYSLSFDIGDLSTGNYIVKGILLDENVIFSKKIIKK